MSSFDANDFNINSRYYTALTQNIKFKYKDVFASAAEVIGLSMKITGSNKDFVSIF